MHIVYGGNICIFKQNTFIKSFLDNLKILSIFILKLSNSLINFLIKEDTVVLFIFFYFAGTFNIIRDHLLG